MHLKLFHDREGSRPPLARPGFTLIEMLVVIAIIGVLASLIAGASMRVIGMQAQKNTALLVQKTSNAVYARWSAVVEQANNEQQIVMGNGVAMPFGTWAKQTFVMNITKGDIRAARLLYIDLRLKQQFPQNYGEAWNGPGGGLPKDPFYQRMMSTGVNWGDSGQLQSGVCLWMALKNSSNGAIANQDIFTPQETMPVNRQLFALVDAWRQPLQFQRMPYWTYMQKTGGLGLPNAPIRFDLDPQLDPRKYSQFYYFPAIASFGAPKMNQPIYSYQQTIGGPIGG